jgi:CheY-like chemotaxis protein
MSHRPIDIIVADDNAVLLNVLSEILEECGYSVRSAVGGLEALTHAQSTMGTPCITGVVHIAFTWCNWHLVLSILKPMGSLLSITIPDCFGNFDSE